MSLNLHPQDKNRHKMAQHHELQAEVTAFLSPPPSGLFTSLCPDICELIISFIRVGTGDSSTASLINKRWQEHVRECPLWEAHFKQFYPFSFASLDHPATSWKDDLVHVARNSRGRKQFVSPGSKKATVVASPVNHGGVRNFFSGLFQSIGDLFFTRLISKQETKILLVGLDGVGKTTILDQLHVGKIVRATPTIGFNVETIKYNNLVLTCWDIGGQAKLRPLWRHYYSNLSCLVFVVDSRDIARMDAAASELHEALAHDELPARTALLIFATFQDLSNALTVEQVAAALQLQTVEGRPWCIQSAVGTTGEGLKDGLDWLSCQPPLDCVVGFRVRSAAESLLVSGQGEQFWFHWDQCTMSQPFEK